MSRSTSRTRFLPFLCVGTFLCAAPALADDSGSAAGDASLEAAAHRRCAQQFEATQRQDMESFRDFDAEAFRAVHHPDAVSVFASGFVAIGIEDIMAALAGHFRNRNAVWSWTELHRDVQGCRTATILYDATYDIPSIGFHQRALTAVTYTYQHGRWLGTFDQGTMLEAPK